MKRRNTATKEAVLSTLRRADTALSHDMIRENLEEKADRTTIYRILNRFCEDGILHRIVADDGKQYFALCAEGCANNDHHHDHFHFRCLNCEKVECLDQEISIQLPAGYVTTNFNGVVSGRCRDCQ